MTPRRFFTLALACALLAVLAGCGDKGEEITPTREGIAAPLGGLDYNVFITRQLNPKDVEDRDYYNGPEESAECAAANGTPNALTPAERVQRCPTSLFGVFVQVCNNESKGAPVPAREPREERGLDVAGNQAAPRELPGDFEIEDSQGNKFEPIVLPPSNVFAYRSRPLTKGNCIPAAGSAAFNAPTAGALLVFRIPVAATENRPLELTVSSGGATRRFELDI
jgi:predicted small lipoprotein YifL